MRAALRPTRSRAVALGAGLVMAAVTAGPAHAADLVSAGNGVHAQAIGKAAAVALPSIRQSTGASGAFGAGNAPSPAQRAAARPQAGPNDDPRWAGYYYGPVTVDPGRAEWVEVYCPAGMQATSGGESNSGYNDVTLHSTYALGGGSGWHALVTNDSNSTRSVYAWVVCMSGLTNYSQPQQSESPIPPGGIGASSMMYGCQGQGQQVVGGGVGPDSVAVDIGELDPFAPVFGVSYTGWESVVTNTSTTSTANVFSQEICAAGINNYSEPQTDATAIAPGNYSVVAQQCPAGTFVLGGGGVGNYAFKYTDSLPSGNGWRIWEANAFGDRTYYVTAKAICGN